jgi:FkbM family methyltransferase
MKSWYLTVGQGMIDVFADKLLEKVMVFYGTRFPFQRGSWRLIEPYLRSGHLTGCHTRGQLTRVTRGDFLFDLDLTDFVDQYVYLGAYEKQDYDELTSIMPVGGVFVDVGAHIGIYTLAMARTAGPSGSVHSFEPNPASFERLSHHVFLNGLANVCLNQVAVGSAEGRAKLNAPTKENSGAASLLSTNMPARFAARPIEVQVTSLDAYCSRHLFDRVDLIKIDCQGYEVQVLEGGWDVLQTFRPRLLLEYDVDWLLAAGASGTQLCSMVKRARYDCFQRRHGRLVQFTADDTPGTVVNIHAIPSEKKQPLTSQSSWIIPYCNLHTQV